MDNNIEKQDIDLPVPAEEPVLDQVIEQHVEEPKGPELLFGVFCPAGLEVFNEDWENTVIRPMPKYQRIMIASTLKNFGVQKHEDLEWAINIPKFREAMFRFICCTTVTTPGRHPHPTSLRFKGEVGWKTFAKQVTDDEKFVEVLKVYIDFLDIFNTPTKLDLK